MVQKRKTKTFSNFNVTNKKPVLVERAEKNTLQEKNSYEEENSNFL